MASTWAVRVSQYRYNFCCPKPSKTPRTSAESQGYQQHLFPQPRTPTTDTSHKPFLSSQITDKRKPTQITALFVSPSAPKQRAEVIFEKRVREKKNQVSKTKFLLVRHHTHCGEQQAT
jgi:hypothetical protein